MLEARELRIGNLINHINGSSFKVEGVYFDVIENNSLLTGFWICQDLGDSIPFKDIKPIPLTEEWLVKMGFEKHKLLGSYILNHFRFHTQRPHKKDPKLFNLVTEIYYCERSILVVGGVNHVHQLQNLYFALTGSELTIK